MTTYANTANRSSETVATTALLTYNGYKSYINPQATGKQLLKFSNWVVPGFAIVAAGVACGFNHAGFSVGFLITAIGIFVDSAIVPMACTIMWKKQSKAAVLISPLASSAAGLIAWFLKAHTEYGEITIATLSGNLPLVAGNMMALCGPIVLTPLITYIKPDDFDWTLFKTEIKRGDDEHIVIEDTPKSRAEAEAALSHHEAYEAENEKILLRARTRAAIASITLCLCLLILWPIPMYGTGYVFSKGFFTGWVVVLFLWSFFAAGTITLLPIFEARTSIRTFFHGLIHPGDKSSHSHAVMVGEVLHPSELVETTGEKNEISKDASVANSERRLS